MTTFTRRYIFSHGLSFLKQGIMLADNFSHSGTAAEDSDGAGEPCEGEPGEVDLEELLKSAVGVGDGDEGVVEYDLLDAW